MPSTGSKVVRFWILLNDRAFLGPKVDRELLISNLCTLLEKHQSAKDALADVGPEKCEFYKFSTPVPSDCDNSAILAQRCIATREDWIKIGTTKRVKHLAESDQLAAQFACLVIQTPRGPLGQAIHSLQHGYGELFTCLQIHVLKVQAFSKADVLRNMRSSDFWASGQKRTVEDIIKLETDLVAIRTYEQPSDPNSATSRDLGIANHYPEHFEQYFAVCHPAAAPDVKNAREFITFFSLFRCHAEDAEAIAADSASPQMKLNHLASHFLMPPFSVCRPSDSQTTLKTGSPWRFPIFLATLAEPSTWCKLTPVSDFSASVEKFSCPLIMCEVISNEDQSGRWRMLLQGIALARVLYYLKKPDSSIGFFAVAIYLRSNLTAERYVIMQTDPNGQVSIAQTDYNLKDASDSRNFLKELYNLQIKFDAMANELDDAKKGKLQAIAKCADPIPSLSRRREMESEKQLKSQANQMTSSVTEAEDDFTEDADVQKYLDEMGYRVESLVVGHPNVAIISRISDSSDCGFLKFTETTLEVDILKHLSQIKDPNNHTIPGFKSWPLPSGAFIFYTSSGGGHLTDLKKPDVHVWSVAKQLAEGVAFMHKNDVAHLDIKPENILIPPKGGRLSINDFSIAVLVDKPNKKYRGKVGTKGYIAPEVWAGKIYDPFHADLWSCGQMLQKLILRCKLTKETEFLGSIAVQLMAHEPQARPMMSDVLARMTAFESLSLERPQPEMGFHSSVVTSAARA